MTVVSLGNLRGITRGQLGGVGIGRIHQQLDGGVAAARHFPAKVSRNNQSSARDVANQGFFRLPIYRPGDNFENNGGPEGINEVTGGCGVIQVLNHDGKMVYGERVGGAQQQEQDERQYQRQSQRTPVAHDLSQLFAGLGKNSPHTSSLSVFRGRQSLFAGLFYDADKHIFQREMGFANIQDMDTASGRSEEHT